MPKPQLLREWIALPYTAELIRESREKNGGKLVISGVVQKAETKNQNQRVYPRGVLQREVENYQKAIRESRAVGELDHPECVSDGYHLLSTTGWVPLEGVKEGDNVATLNVQTGELEYQPVTKKIDERLSGKMVRIYNARTIDQLLTPNHRVLLWDRDDKPYFMDAIDVHKNNGRDGRLSHSSMRRGAVWRGNDPDFIKLPGTEHRVAAEDWAAFLGIWLAEGSADGVVRGHKVNNGVSIFQKKDETRKEIEGLLLRMGFFELTNVRIDPTGFKFTLGSDFHKFFFDIGHSGVKRMPVDVKQWSPRLLSVMLEWMLKGDGRNRVGYKHSGQETAPIVKEYATTSPGLADDVQEVMVKLGYGGTIHTYQPGDRPMEGDRWILAENSRPMNIVYGHVSRGISMDSRFLKTELVDYDGGVHCVQVPNGTWLARSPSGHVFWTGNSSTVSLDRASHIVREMWWDGDNVMGRVEVLTTPKGKVLESLLECGVTIGISSRGVGTTEKTNEGTDMVQPDYQIICWDIVSEPSTPGAYLFREGVDRSVEPVRASKADRIFRALNEIVLRR